MGHSEDANSIQITSYDLERMRGVPPNDRYAKFLRKKEELRSLSKERYNKWPNTITAMREKRLTERRKELEKKEEDLRKQDVIDAQSRAERRRQQIAKANKMLQIAHLRKARTKLLMSSILEEREAQINYKKEIDKLWDKQEERWVDFQCRQRETWNHEDEVELEKKKAAVQILKMGRLQQLDERKSQRQKLLQIKEEEKTRLNRQEKEDQESAKDKEEIKKRKILETRREIVACNIDQQTRREAEKIRLKEMEKQIEEFAAYRDRVEQERKDARAKEEVEKLAHRETMLKKLEKQLLEARTDTEKRLQTQEAAYIAAEDKKIQDKACKAQEDWAQCDRSRQQQIRLRKEQMVRDKKNDLEEAMGVHERLRIMEAAEKENQMKIRERNTYFSNQNLQLASERQERELREREDEKKDYQNAFEAMERDEILEASLSVED